jgi:hypothetical protein
MGQIVNRIGGAGTDIGQELPDPPWPVAARDLLTQRERSLYQSLLALYPEHKIFVQVALSQLIDVPEDHPERKSIRNRFSQLVADFVLCRSNLSVVAVIELDDRSHERADRQAADVRKNKALSDAGLRLVRIPAGTLPSEERLREIIDADHAFGGSANEATRDRRFMPAESGIELAEDWGSAGPDHMVGSPDSRDLELRSWKWSAIKAGLAGVTLIGGWFLYGQFLLVMAHRALQPLAVPHVTATSPSSTTTPLAPSRIPVASVAVGLSAEDLAERKRTELQAATAAKQQKDLAWAAYYSAPASCEHPTDWTAQVECGNQYMRAKRQFEKQWVALHGTVPGIVGAVVLDDASIGAARR